MENKDLKFKKTTYRDYCTIILEADSSDIYATIGVLLDCLAGMPEDLFGNQERYYVVQLLKSLIPSKEQMKLIADLQLKKTRRA